MHTVHDTCMSAVCVSYVLMYAWLRHMYVFALTIDMPA